MKDIFKSSKDYVTHSNMTELLAELKEQEEVQVICREHSLNLALLKNLFLLASKGYNKTDVAKKLGVHRVTVQRYDDSLKKMKQEDFIKLHTFVFKEDLMGRINILGRLANEE